MAEVIFKDVIIRYGKFEAVKNFCLKVKDEEFIILVGPSGCGKTTTLRAVAGLEDVASGEIYIGDRIINNVLSKDRDIAMVFQNYALYPHMDVFSNMAFGLKMRGGARKDIDQIVKKTAELLGINNLLDRKPSELSGGQCQRVALGRALVRNPKVFLFDEPLSNLDAKLRITMRAELLDLHQRLRTTTIYVTHDQMEAMTMGDRIVVMKEGVIEQVDTPENVYNHPLSKYVAGFIGSPSMNFVDCQIISKDNDLYLKKKGIELRIPQAKSKLLEEYINRKVIFGIRPEHISEVSERSAVDKGATLRASIWVTEMLGSEKLVHMKNETDTLVARLGAHIKYQPGDITDFTVSMDHAHIFDKETENAIF